MKFKGLRSSVLFPVAAAVLICLTGFEISDVTYDSCPRMDAKAADCASFTAAGAGQAQNVILIIGDGMGIGATYAARVLLNGPDQPFAWETLPNRGLVTTCALNGVTDSAAAATALATGHKTFVGMLSMLRGNEKPATILEQVHHRKAAGLVTDAPLWDATPAAFAAHAPSRTQSAMIARQMVLESRPEVMLGGGAKAFTRGGSQSEDLIAAAKTGGYQVVRTAAEMKALDLAATRRLLGLFAAGDMEFEPRRPADTTEPRLTEMARTALTVLSNDPRGFFLMIEQSNIDHAEHKADLDLVLGAMEELNRTIELVLAWAAAHPNTLVIITADHETGGWKIAPRLYQRGDHVKVSWTTGFLGIATNHSTQEVPIYAIGPNAGAIRPHLDNTEVYCLMRNAFGVNP